MFKGAQFHAPKDYATLILFESISFNQLLLLVRNNKPIRLPSQFNIIKFLHIAAGVHKNLPFSFLLSERVDNLDMNEISWMHENSIYYK